MDDEARRLNRYKRPHYAAGDKVRVTIEGPLHDEVVEVLWSDAWQTIGGDVATYFYRLKRANGATVMLAEDDLAPLP